MKFTVKNVLIQQSDCHICFDWLLSIVVKTLNQTNEQAE